MAAYEDTIRGEDKTSPSNIGMGKIKTLSDAKKRDLIVLCANPNINVLWELMENIVIDSRDAAMAIDPADEKRQRAGMTIAHAQAKMYTKVRETIQYITEEHLNETRRLEYEKAMGTQEEIERIVLEQTQ